MQRHQEIVGARGAIVLLRIEPARRDVGVPGKDHFAGRRGGLRACRTGGRRDPRHADAAPARMPRLPSAIPCGEDASAPLRAMPRSMFMSAHSLHDRVKSRSLDFGQDVRGPGPAMRPPWRRAPEVRSADLPQECSGTIARNVAVGDQILGTVGSTRYVRFR